MEGRIEPRGSPPRTGVFRVTTTFDEHRNRPDPALRGSAIDISNSLCTAKVIAMADGHVSTVVRPVDPRTQALVVRINHGNGNSTGYAHMSTIFNDIQVGTPVARGRPLGIVGSSGTSFGCHLHFDLTLNGTRVDPWPRLEQNQQADMNITMTIYPAPRKWRTKAGTLTGRRLSPSPLRLSGTFLAGSPADADAGFTITPTPSGWPAGPYMRVSTGALAGFLVAESAVDADPVPTPVNRAARIAAAEAPLKARIIELEGEVADLKERLKKAGIVV